MHSVSPRNWGLPYSLLGLICVMLWLMSMGAVAAANNSPADILRAKYLSLGDKLKHNQFKRPLVLDSTESPTSLKGDIFALVDYPFATVNAALNDPNKAPANWCDVLIQHINTKYCRAESAEKDGLNTAVLNVNIGKKTPQAIDDAYRVAFDYQTVASTTDYFQIALNAEQGPLSTKDYHMSLEAVAIDDKHTFLHLTYAYSYGMAGRLAMKTYLATIGSGKVGFTILEKSNSGKQSAGSSSNDQPNYVGGVRGVIERNTMRYYLAIDAYLASLSASPANQLDERLQRWFTSTERYARQLHEVERDEYITMKQNEYRRQQSTR